MYTDAMLKQAQAEPATVFSLSGRVLGGLSDIDSISDVEHAEIEDDRGHRFWLPTSEVIFAGDVIAEASS